MATAQSLESKLILLLPLSARCHELLITGHGLDPSIPTHSAHHSIVFASCLMILGFIRTRLLRKDQVTQRYLDLVTVSFLLMSWFEKRNSDTSRNGFIYCRVALFLWSIGFVQALYGVVKYRWEKKMVTIKIGIGILIVTGPSAAASLIVVCSQIWILQRLNKLQQITPAVQAFLWRLIIRHAFFATNHACAFNRLHLSAAFIASIEFNFFLGGIYLFLNTFGWEFIGLLSIPQLNWYSLFQSLETAISCISVSLMRRHLMVWAIFAPRFLFAAIFLIINCLGQIVNTLFVSN